ncbi:MAG: LPS export ABC transporter periplasmic protein LptC [Candidatus Thiodiazotropha lotti]|uniref:LPS export ABC transporter periplasmic protein LptC n=1 Tax=Candidatus Thiodiazotropha lotti TaxID=2792787 RepID=A0A9E4K5D4_9GAMM|nr:LPS export ABC transporter periplasmic protein LptC [Candidatus Thiodiazotropha lotti]MCG7939015.1 LPS export ABC transporter periplasmic protein LptC [Candidatus Thiodiazotropha lotti]MCW4203489.1 LPS export ABC transporter periplasmic protein LptC [Candidatus Thiodiazotropha lotti]
MNRRLLGLLLMFALVMSVAWWVNELRQPEIKRPELARDTPDTYAVNLLVKQYDDDGQLLQTLQTPRMTHYEKRGITELSKPVVQRFRSNEPGWRMRGENGLADHRQETLFLPGQVVIEREGVADFAPYRIETEDLTIHAEKSYAETVEAVRINSGVDWLSAIGMRIWFDEPSRLKLLGQVRGHYEFE